MSDRPGPRQRVSCAFCHPPRAWRTSRPAGSYKRHLRRFHPEEWEYYLRHARFAAMAEADVAPGPEASA